MPNMTSPAPARPWLMRWGSEAGAARQPLPISIHPSSHAREDEYNLKALTTTEPEGRSFFNSLFIDGVFVLGSGYVLVDTGLFRSPLANMNMSLDHIWIGGKENELAILWTLVNMLNEKLMWNDFDMAKYLESIAC